MQVTFLHRVEYGLLIVIVSFIRILPLQVAAGLSAWSWRVIATKTRRHTRAMANLAKAMPDKSEAERRRIALAMWDNLGRVMAETFVLDRLVRDPARIAFKDRYIVDRYTDKLGRSVFASLHMGNWELAGWPLRLINANPGAVYRVVENPLVDRYVRRQREHIWPAGLFDKGSGVGGSAVPNLLRHLQSGSQLGMLTDLMDSRGIQVPFFGHPVWAGTAPAWLARRMGARLWLVKCTRRGKTSYFDVTAHEIKVIYSDDLNADIRAITEAIFRQFEAWIRETPEQWMWSNKRWPESELARDAASAASEGAKADKSISAETLTA